MSKINNQALMRHHNPAKIVHLLVQGTPCDVRNAIPAFAVLIGKLRLPLAMQYKDYQCQVRLEVTINICSDNLSLQSEFDSIIKEYLPTETPPEDDKLLAVDYNDDDIIEAEEDK